MVKGTCGVVGCFTKAYSKFHGIGRLLCSKHYQQVQKAGKVLEMKDGVEDEVFPNFPPPVVAHHSKRCTAILRNGTRCPRKKSVKNLCSAHHKELEDQERCELRAKPIDAVGGGFEGNEAALIAQQEQAQ
jgi:hypothetical protein